MTTRAYWNITTTTAKFSQEDPKLVLHGIRVDEQSHKKLSCPACRRSYDEPPLTESRTLSSAPGNHDAGLSSTSAVHTLND
jgi:hypothetical protein